MTKRNTFTPEIDAEILRLHATGMIRTDIAAAIGMGRTATSNRIKELGLVKEAPRQLKWTPEMDATIRRYINVLTRGEIAKKIGQGATASAVISRCARLGLRGVSPAAPQSWTADEDLFLREHVGSMSQKEMADEIGRDPSSVSRRLDKLGLKVERAVVTYIAPKAKPVEDLPLTARPWIEFRKGECKYPYGERGSYMACCAPVWKGGNYCESHSALCGGYKKVEAA